MPRIQPERNGGAEECVQNMLQLPAVGNLPRMKSVFQAEFEPQSFGIPKQTLETEHQ